ncbi:hypothetical protein GCM10010177_42160 [Actinomadura citrea]|nr:hypothetical protein GCM10010177_42160 [Actinomadura citrea]
MKNAPTVSVSRKPAAPPTTNPIIAPVWFMAPRIGTRPPAPHRPAAGIRATPPVAGVWRAYVRGRIQRGLTMPDS